MASASVVEDASVESFVVDVTVNVRFDAVAVVVIVGIVAVFGMSSFRLGGSVIEDARIEFSDVTADVTVSVEVVGVEVVELVESFE